VVENPPPNPEVGDSCPATSASSKREKVINVELLIEVTVKVISQVLSLVGYTMKIIDNPK
jgi:hypothetical protein